MRLLTLLLAAILAAVLASPTEWRNSQHTRRLFNPIPEESFIPRRYDINIRRMMDMDLEKNIPQKPHMSNNPKIDWINREIEHLNRVMPEGRNPHKPGVTHHINDIAVPIYKKSAVDMVHNYAPVPIPSTPPFRPLQSGTPEEQMKARANYLRSMLRGTNDKNFANSPMDRQYYERVATVTQKPVMPMTPGPVEPEGEIPSREIRQNPNLSRNRNLVQGDLEKLNNQFTMPPVGEGIEVEEAKKPEKANVGYTMFSTAMLAAFGAGAAVIITGLGIGLYRRRRRAKAAADVDYPAYGVTGPTIDNSGDRKLAQSAHMCHFKQQKQQILAMERGGMSQRSGSVTDPESEEDNEEGDYTVYECPGFATTGDMEVKNPLFADDTTPATPGICEIVKPQPKE